MKKRFARITLTALVVLMTTLALVGTAFAAEFLTIPLHNNTAEPGTDCPDDGGAYWHFVISPNNDQSAFIVFHLNLGGATTYDTSVFVQNGDQWDNVFVAVPAGKMLTSLITSGSTAEIVWQEVGPQPDSFKLSHVCPATAEDLTVSKTARPSYTRTFDWTIDKSADKDTVYSAGGGESEPVNYTVAVTKDAGTDSDWAVSGVITVHNPNKFAVNGVSLSDATPGGTCTVTPASVDVAAESDATADYVCTFASNPGSGINTATATWTDFGSPSTSASFDKDYTFGDPTTLVNDAIDVTDTFGGSWHFTASGSVSYSKTFTDPAGTCTSHENTATITQTGASDSVTVEDCQGADLTVSKTAVPSYDLTYAWNITKSVDQTSAKVDPGQLAIFNYTVTVSHDAGTESNWNVSGEITVTNPNDWQDVVVDVTDSLCAISGGEDVTVPAAGSVTLPYSCDLSSTASGTNTATATWDAAAYHTLNGSASGSVDFAFGDPTNVYDECIAVTDSQAGFLGTVCVGDTNPKTFTYSKSFNGPASGTCVDYDNTATFTTNDYGKTGSASAKVTVCSWKSRLTPGYWKNHLALTGTTGCKSLPSGTSCNNNGPFAKTYLPLYLGNFQVPDILTTAKIFAAMNCSSTKDQDSVGCLAGHLLAAKLNVANGANSCIAPTVTAADNFLKGVNYTGPAGKYVLTSAQRSQAISLKSALDAYNNNLGCH